MWFQLDAWIRGGDECCALEPALPINFLSRHPEGRSKLFSFLCWAPSGLGIALIYFIHFIITFSFPLLFIECSWDQRIQKVRPLWPLYQCQGVYVAARISLHHFSKLHSLFGPLWLPLLSAQAPLHHPDYCLLQPICFWLVWEWEIAASVGLGFIFKTHANSGKVGCFSWNVWKA